MSLPDEVRALAEALLRDRGWRTGVANDAPVSSKHGPSEAYFVERAYERALAIYSAQKPDATTPSPFERRLRTAIRKCWSGPADDPRGAPTQAQVAMYLQQETDDPISLSGLEKRLSRVKKRTGRDLWAAFTARRPEP